MCDIMACQLPEFSTDEQNSSTKFYRQRSEYNCNRSHNQGSIDRLG
jgi:hypothetical protein